jgi:hypothetical protein
MDTDFTWLYSMNSPVPNWKNAEASNILMARDLAKKSYTAPILITVAKQYYNQLSLFLL